jgi:hypothetical protein
MLLAEQYGRLHPDDIQAVPQISYGLEHVLSPNSIPLNLPAADILIPADWTAINLGSAAADGTFCRCLHCYCHAAHHNSVGLR